MLAIVGQIPLPVQGRGFGVLHELSDQTAVLQQVTKNAFAVSGPDDAAGVIQSAIDALVSGVPRPVSLEVPANLWSAPTTGAVAAPAVTAPPLNTDAVEQAAALLSAAERPLIVVGSGAYGASASVIELAEKLQIPVTTRRQGHGVMPTSHPLFVPLTVAHELWADADVVLGIGSRVEWPLLQWGHDADLHLIQINIDPDEINRHGITTIGLLADADDACRALIDSVEPTARPSIATDLDARRAAFHEATTHLQPQRSFTAAIREALPDDGVLVEDVTQIGFASHLLYDHLAPRTFLTTGAAGTLGSATAVAIGAAYAADAPVVGIVGDGGFLFTATELATAVQHDVNCNIVVFNDGAYGNVKRIQQTRFGADRTIASTLQNPDFQQFASSFGVRPWQTDSPDGLRDALRASISHDGPSLVEVTVGEMPNPWPFFQRPRVRSMETTN